MLGRNTVQWSVVKEPTRKAEWEIMIVDIRGGRCEFETGDFF